MKTCYYSRPIVWASDPLYNVHLHLITLNSQTVVKNILISIKRKINSFLKKKNECQVQFSLKLNIIIRLVRIYGQDINCLKFSLFLIIRNLAFINSDIY